MSQTTTMSVYVCVLSIINTSHISSHFYYRGKEAVLISHGRSCFSLNKILNNFGQIQNNHNLMSSIGKTRAGPLLSFYLGGVVTSDAELLQAPLARVGFKNRN